MNHCSIYLDEISVEYEVRTICNHTYHLSCLKMDM